jgi:hypothetical protein
MVRIDVEFVPAERRSELPSVILRCTGCYHTDEYSIACDFSALVTFLREHQSCCTR